MLVAKDILPHAGAVDVNAASGKETWLFGRDVTGILVVRSHSHAGDPWNGWIIQSNCCVASKPWPTVWKQTSGEDQIVEFHMDNANHIFSNTMSPSAPFGTFEDITAAAGLPATYTLNSAALTGTGTAKKVNLVVTDSSNRLFTLDFNDLGSAGWALHTVLTSTGTQVNTRGYPATISADGVVIGGRNTLSRGNEHTMWRAIKGRTHFQIDTTSSSPGTTGLPAPGRFISGQAGTHANGVHYRGAANSLLMQQTTSLCTGQTVIGTVGTSSHLLAVNSNTNPNQLIISGFPGTCLTSANTTHSAPVLSDESKLSGWSQSDDGTHIFYKTPSGGLSACWIKGTSASCSGGVVDMGLSVGP